MILAIYPFAVALVGLLIYVLTNSQSNPKLVEVGRILFFVGVLWFVYTSAARVVRF